MILNNGILTRIIQQWLSRFHLKEVLVTIRILFRDNVLTTPIYPHQNYIYVLLSLVNLPKIPLNSKTNILKLHGPEYMFNIEFFPSNNYILVCVYRKYYVFQMNVDELIKSAFDWQNQMLNKKTSELN